MFCAVVSWPTDTTKNNLCHKLLFVGAKEKQIAARCINFFPFLYFFPCDISITTEKFLSLFCARKGRDRRYNFRLTPCNYVSSSKHNGFFFDFQRLFSPAREDSKSIVIYSNVNNYFASFSVHIKTKKNFKRQLSLRMKMILNDFFLWQFLICWERWNHKKGYKIFLW